MIEGISFKVCGLTSASDAKAAHRSGADFLGFNLYPKSPRYVPLEQYKAMAPELPTGKRVAVMVEPEEGELASAVSAGFEFFQIHFQHDTPLTYVAIWSESVGAERLWLAPKLPPDAEVNSAWLPYAKFFLLDSFEGQGFGGSGKTGDWGKFSRHRRAFPRKQWILAGGLDPDNIVDAVRSSGAKYVDVNSGVESSPGVKDHAKMAALAAALRTVKKGAKRAAKS